MKRVERKIALRCAVYTRVSTNSSLEQDFNSLDNQREASQAYVRSSHRVSHRRPSANDVRGELARRALLRAWPKLAATLFLH